MIVRVQFQPNHLTKVLVSVASAAIICFMSEFPKIALSPRPVAPDALIERGHACGPRACHGVSLVVNAVARLAKIWIMIRPNPTGIARAKADIGISSVSALMRALRAM